MTWNRLRSRRFALALCTILAANTVAHALDIPVFGKRLVVTRSARGREKVVFIATGANITSPAPGGLADPLTSSAAGAFIELVSSGASPVGAFVAPWGPRMTPEPGWTSSAGGATLTYKNPAAPAGESVVKTLVLKQANKLKIVAKHAGLRLAGTEGTVGVRFTIGRGTPNEIRICSQFGPAEAVRDQAGAYSAKRAPAAALADCSDASLGTSAELNDAISLDIGGCGPQWNGVGSSTLPGTDLHRVTLNGALEVCNDGSPAVFYVRRANAGMGHDNDWLVWLEGGSSCTDPASCAERWCGIGSQAAYGAHKMSSQFTHQAIRGNGIFRQNAANNFKDFNLVVSYYCSSDNYVGRDALDVEPINGFPGYRVAFNGQAILQGMLARLRGGVTSDDGAVTLDPIDASARVLFSGTSGGGEGATFNIDRVADWAATVPVASFKVTIDARVGPGIDDPGTLSAGQKEFLLSHGAAKQAFRNDILDASCADFHAADDPRKCGDSSHVLLHHVAQTYFIHQDLADPVVGPGIFSDMNLWTPAARDYLATQFLNRQTIAEELPLRTLPTPVVFSPLCSHHVGLESGAFYDNAVRVPPAAFTDYNDNLGSWWNDLNPPSLIDGIGGAVTDLANCVS